MLIIVRVLFYNNMATYNFTDIDEIVVRLKSGDDIIYKGRGILKLKKSLDKIILGSKKQPNLISGSSSDEDTTNSTINSPGNYNTLGVKYSSPKGTRSALELARDMQKQAETASNIKF